MRLAYSPGVNRKYRFEVKSVDGTANPYLAVSAIMLAGLDGIRKKLQLDQKQTTGEPDPNESDRLPHSIEEAMSNVEQSTEYEFYCKGMGKTLVDIYLAVRKGEVEHMRQLTEEEQLQFVIKYF